MDLETKARLIAVGTVRLEEPQQEGRASTAGPGAGGQSIFFQSGPHMVRLSVTADSPLRLESRPDGAAIVQQGRELGGFWVELAQLLRSHPWTVRRLWRLYQLGLFGADGSGPRG